MKNDDSFISKGFECLDIKDDDIKTIKALHEVTDKGKSAEVQKMSDGTFKVFEFKRNIVKN